ncbi:sucrose-6-phosphate hydrolase [Romboutsia ilealis]|uniref:Sucrose-6-phosphate hydrolase n=1 Tax=Romboutsia faecis TaxID=2764597 RepID=A0ABR7JMY0_9FIRM|nr:glycoside hydrolase family 32 protein [Romboutsia faecis]MBC5996268.1 glycoside hydrolase family 32 protein [Romboutsia faecis]MRN25090.1 sucrose-6-phosphate hydrolase [Romboutsia ilealis]
MSIIEKEFTRLIDICKSVEGKKINNDPYRLKYHLMPPIGWLNDPNGLCQFKGDYYIFYQYSPFDVNGGLKLWGLYVSKDLVNWEDRGAVIFPDTIFDIHGVYSGSAFVEDDKVYFFYTGNVKHLGNHDYIYSGRGHNTMMLTSEDGVGFSEKKVILENIDYPDNMTCHVRDPKILKKDATYYMILGARDKSDKGCILLYKSNDLNDWIYVNTISTIEKFGYMWECPDLIQLKDIETQEVKYMLLVSPQGIKEDGYKYNNIYQSGYFLGDMDFENGEFIFDEFIELDRGFDFYAPQSFVDEKGRTILIGWMGLPDIEEDYYINPTYKNGWMHALTMPRQLILVNGKLHQLPIKEIEKLRRNKLTIHLESVKEYDKLKGSIYELEIKFNNEIDNFELSLKSDCIINYSKEAKVLRLNLGKSGYGRCKRAVKIGNLEALRIFVDTSSIEVFVNYGEEVFTSRMYCYDFDDKISMKGNLDDVKINLYELGEYKYV